MKVYMTLITAVLIASTAVPTRAGVLITEESMVGGKTAKTSRTLMLEGSREKWTSGRQTIIIDIGKGAMDVIDPTKKSYVEMPFPPKGQMAAALQTMGGMTLSFHKTGKEDKIAGFACQEFSGSGSTAMADFSHVGCFSTSAPGAAEFTAFNRKLFQKMKDPASVAVATPPEGIPMSLETTTKFKKFSIPGMNAKQAQMMEQMMANRPPVVTKTVVTTVKETSFPSGTFDVPADYTKREMTVPKIPKAGAGGSAGGEAPAPGK